MPLAPRNDTSVNLGAADDVAMQYRALICPGPVPVLDLGPDLGPAPPAPQIEPRTTSSSKWVLRDRGTGGTGHDVTLDTQKMRVMRAGGVIDGIDGMR